MRLALQNFDGTSAGYLDWNPKTGELAGPLAGEVAAIIATATAESGVVTHPYPTFYEIRDPYHDPAELGLLLGQFWRVPEPLSSALEAVVSRVRQDAPEGAAY